MLTDRSPVVVEPNITDRRQPKGAEQAVVGVYDHAKGRSLVAVVDVAARDVLGVEETPVQFQLGAEEQEEAETLAARDPRVEAFLGGREANPLTRLYFPPDAGKDDPPHRYGIVFLRPTTSERLYAVVDLTDRRVHAVLPPPDA